MELTNILITSAGRRVSLVKSFIKELNCFNEKAKVFCTDLEPDLSAACQVSHGYFKVNRVTHSNYINELINICTKNKIGLIIPTIDTELEMLAKNRITFNRLGINVLISDLSFIYKCRNKRLIHEFFDEIGFDRARDINLDNPVYPFFIKPCDGSHSRGIYKINNSIELKDSMINNPKNMFLEYIPHSENTEYTIDIYFNKDSKIKCIVPRERIFVRDGEVNTACTRKNIIIDYVKEKFQNVKGLRGCITLQVFLRNENNKIIGIEINPRFGGGYPLSYLSGANFPKWIIQEYLEDKFDDSYFDNWKDNLLMIRYDDEVLIDGYKG